MYNYHKIVIYLYISSHQIQQCYWQKKPKNQHAECFSKQVGIFMYTEWVFERGGGGFNQLLQSEDLQSAPDQGCLIDYHV